MAFYELVNLSSGNRIGEFDTEQQALHDVWIVFQQRGTDAIAAIALTRENDDGQSSIIAEGEELALLAERASAVVA